MADIEKMKYQEYDSPFIMNIIDRMSTQITENLDNMAYSAVLRAGIVVDRDILLQALQQDSERYREAFRRGHETGYADRDSEIVRCKDCKHYEYAIGCVKWHDVCTGGDEWFCADGERKEDDLSEE